MDCLNHRRGEQVTWECRDHAACFVTRSAVVPGAQVFNNYGAKSNEEFVASYGFVQPGGPDDVLVLALRRPNDGELEMVYWSKAQAEPPAEVLQILTDQMAQEDANDPEIASLLRQANACEALEQFLHMRRSHFTRTQHEVDDALPWMAEDGTDGVRESILTMIREYRNGTYTDLPRPSRAAGTRREVVADQARCPFGRA